MGQVLRRRRWRADPGHALQRWIPSLIPRMPVRRRPALIRTHSLKQGRPCANVIFIGGVETRERVNPMTRGGPDPAPAMTGEDAPFGWAGSEEESWESIRKGTAANTTTESITGAPAVAGAAAPPSEFARPENETRHPVRLMLGMAVLAGERLSGGAPTSEAFATGVGLLQQGAAEARTLARRIVGPTARTASQALEKASDVPASESAARSISRSRRLLGRILSDAKTRGEASVAAGRTEASTFIQTSVTDGIAWAQAKAMPQIIDGMLPYLVDNVIPRVIDGVMPEIRSRVLPVVIDDLTHDPRLRELMLEQSKGAVGEATQHRRATTANADDRVERALRRGGRGQSPTGTDKDASAAKPGETPQAPTDEATNRPSDE